MYVFACLHVCAHECSCSQRLEVLGPLELGFQVCVSPVTWVLGTELQSSARIVKAHGQ